MIRMAVIRAGLTGADHAKMVAEELPGATLQLLRHGKRRLAASR
ncbi:hypothetical protein [Mesorhizobium sp. M1328]